MKPIVTISTSLVMLVASLAVAQDPRGPGRIGFGGPFFGGPGMMQQSSVMLLGMPEVQTELGINEEQRKRVDELLGSLQDKMRESFAVIDFQEIQSLGEEERQKRFGEMRRKSDEAIANSDTEIAKVLAAGQLERLSQLRLQREGLEAFSRADVIARLGLSDQQQERIRDIQESGRPQFGFPPPDFGQIEEQRRKALVEIVSVLSSKQQAKWTEMRGKEFAFPQAQFFGGPPGGPGGPMRQQRKLVSEFDKDGDGRLDQNERRAARESLANQPAGGRRGGFGFGPPGPPGGFGPPGFGRGNREPPKPGPRVSPGDVQFHPDASLYEPTVLRTIFLDFENPGWEAELQDFHGTDVLVPATLTVDGKKYPEVGVHFRGMSSYMMVPMGFKRSLNLSLDFGDKNQRLYGYKTLNLLNAHEDPSFLSTVLYSHIARQYIPAPKANLVRVVINGESWGVYTNAQQFDQVFLRENFNSAKGTRWKVSGSPGGDGGLRYLGANVEEYKRRFEMKANDGDKAWEALIALCRTLNETPLDQLEDALRPILDIESVLWFLALDVALINSDGYWIRASDFNIFREANGKFHIIPHDMNEAFHPGMGPGFGPPSFAFGGPMGGGPGDRDGRRPRDEFGPRGGRPGEPPGPGGPGGEFRRPGGERFGGRGPGGFGPGGPGPGGFGPGGPGRGGNGVEIDPLVGLDDPRKPLRSRLLAVPSLRAKYLQNVRTIAAEWLDWKKLGPIVADYRELIEAEVALDTRKLESFESFERVTANEVPAPGGGGGGREMPLRVFADQRRKYLLDYKPPADERRSPDREAIRGER